LPLESIRKYLVDFLSKAWYDGKLPFYFRGASIAPILFHYCTKYCGLVCKVKKIFEVQAAISNRGGILFHGGDLSSV
jgi:hypothetical protein